MITRADAVKLASELNLPLPLQRLAKGETLEPRLDAHWGNAEEFFLSCGKAEVSIFEGKIIILWDAGSISHVFGVHLPTKKFVEFYIEEDIDPDTLPLWNYQQVVLPIFHSIYEVFIDKGEEQCRRELDYQADLFGFKYVTELMEIGNRNWDDYDRLEKELDEFRNTLI